MPYLTPETLPEGADCRTLLIPASSEWLAIVSGALTELVAKYNWQQFGSVTVEEAVAAMQTMIDEYYEGCQSCVLPGNTPLFRLNRDGEIEQLVDGEWVPPEGDYALPPTPPRGEATEQERRCLAAVNAAAVFEQLYEEISDAFQEGMTFQQWTEFLTATLITLLGTIFGLVIAPLVLIGVLIVGVIYETLEFITADVWTTEFTDMFVCMLYECSSDVGGDVVHFDYPCLMDRLARVTDIFDPTFSQIRLFGQITYIMQILGAQSLDAMGATTGVAEGDCDDCDAPWCRLYDFTVDPYQFELQFPTGGVWTDGIGWEGVYVPTGGNGYFGAYIAAPIACDITSIEMGFTYTQGSCILSADAALGIWSQTYANTFAYTEVCDVPTSPAEFCYKVLDPAVPVTITQLIINLVAGVTSDDSNPGGACTIQYIKLTGTGVPPEGGVECEWEDCF